MRGGHWLMLAFTGLLFCCVAMFVDLKPHVDENFFFSSSDPRFQESAKIDRIFGSDSQMILAVASHDISSPQYLERLERFTEQLRSVESVDSVESLAEGPKSFEDAEKKPSLEAAPDCRKRPLEQRHTFRFRPRYPNAHQQN